MVLFDTSLEGPATIVARIPSTLPPGARPLVPPTRQVELMAIPLFELEFPAYQGLRIFDDAICLTAFAPDALRVNLNVAL